MNKTFRNILTIFLYLVLSVAAAGYFYGATLLRAEGRKEEKCRSIKVTLLDSALNRFISEEEVVEMITDYDPNTIGKSIDSINLTNLENLLVHKSVIKEVEISVTREGIMEVKIRQRKPVIRIDMENDGWYIDETGFVFPLVKTYTSYVPVVTGNISVVGEQIFLGKDTTARIDRIVSLGKYLESNPFWNSQIEQINIEDTGDAVLYTRVGDQKIILGELNNFEEKFDKLYSFYKCVIPKFGWDKYKVINLRYNGQIVCTPQSDKRVYNASEIQ